MSTIATAPVNARRSAFPVDLMLRRRGRVRLGVAFLLGTALLTILLDHCGVFTWRGDDWSNFDRHSFAVFDVQDWRTIRVGETPVRLLGLTLPAVPGAEATARNAILSAVKDRHVTLRLEPTRTRDGDGHLLAFAFADGIDNLNLRLVSDGVLSADASAPLTFRPQLVDAERDARKHRRGFWAQLEPALVKATRRSKRSNN